MKYEEAIKLLEGYVKDTEAGYYINFGYRDIPDFRGIISLLKQGAKLETIKSLVSVLEEYNVSRPYYIKKGEDEYIQIPDFSPKKKGSE